MRQIYSFKPFFSWVYREKEREEEKICCSFGHAFCQQTLHINRLTFTRSQLIRRRMCAGRPNGAQLSAHNYACDSISSKAYLLLWPQFLFMSSTYAHSFSFPLCLLSFCVCSSFALNYVETMRTICISTIAYCITSAISTAHVWQQQNKNWLWLKWMRCSVFKMNLSFFYKLCLYLQNVANELFVSLAGWPFIFAYRIFIFRDQTKKGHYTPTEKTTHRLSPLDTHHLNCLNKLLAFSLKVISLFLFPGLNTSKNRTHSRRTLILFITSGHNW